MSPLVRGIDQVTGASVKSNTGDFGSLWEVVCVERRKKGVLEKHCQKVEVKKKKTTTVGRIMAASVEWEST